MLLSQTIIVILYPRGYLYGSKGLNITLVLTITLVLAFAGAMALPSAYAQSTQDPASMFAVGTPLIVGVVIGAVYWAMISARRSGR